MKSIKTTLLGIGGFIAATWSQFEALLDADAMTNPDWNIVLASLLIALGFTVAKDDAPEDVENK